MAIIFELWGECAEIAEREQLGAYFHGREYRLTTGKVVHLRADQPTENEKAVSVWSPELSRTGVRSVTDALEMTETGLRLYHSLREAPAFMFARVALEAGCIPAAELADWLTDHGSDRRLTVECVVHESIFEALGRPAFCDPSATPG